MVLEIANDIHEVYEVYKEHGDEIKEFIKLGAEIFVGMGVGVAAAFLLPEGLIDCRGNQRAWW